MAEKFEVEITTTIKAMVTQKTYNQLQNKEHVTLTVKENSLNGEIFEGESYTIKKL